MNEANDSIYTFNVIINPKKLYISHPRPTRLKIYPTNLTIKQKPPLRIKHEDIQSIHLIKGKINLNYSGGSIEFTIPSTFGEQVTDGSKTGLFLKLVFGLKNKEDINSIIESLKQIELKKQKITKFIKYLIILSVSLLITGFAFVPTNNDVLVFSLLFPSMACWLIIMIASIIRSRDDAKFLNKNAKIEFHYAIADSLLKAIEEAKSEDEIIFYLEGAKKHLQKILDIDPTLELSSQYVEDLRERIFPGYKSDK